MSEKRKRLLILGEQYYPLQVASTFRLASIAKNIAVHGFDCHVVAPAWNETNLQYVSHAKQVFPGSESNSPCPVTLVEVPHVGYSKIVEYYLKPFSYGKAIGDRLLESCKRLWTEKGFDCIFATAPAFYPLRAALSLGQLYSVPVVADLRDLYGEHDGAKKLSLSKRSAKWMLAGVRQPARMLGEIKRLCNQADLTTTVSQPLVNRLRQMGVKRVKLLLNGFDPDDYPCNSTDREEIFTAVYAGTIHGFQNPQPFLDALDMLVKQKKIKPESFKLLFYTRDSVAPYISGRASRPLIEEHRLVDKQKIIKIMSQASLLLHLSVPSKHGGIFTTKLTDYLGARKPIITVPGDEDVVDEFLEETRAGVSLKDPVAIANFIYDQFQHWQQHGKTRYAVVEAEVEKYTWQVQCKKLADSLNGCLIGPPKD